MGSDVRPAPAATARARRRAAALAAVVALQAARLPAPAAAADPWWVPVGLRGEAVSAVAAGTDGILVVAAGRARCLPSPAAAPPRSVGDGAARCSSLAGRPGGDAPGWALHGGRVYRERPGSAPVLDPDSPDLGPSAHLLAAPAALPGALVAVAEDGTVWRRTGSGSWGRALLLLPRHLLAGPPPVTALAAFASSPLTPAVYLGTDGYAVLVSEDGGDDWLRAGAGLPFGVLALAADARGRAVYAGTRDGLWMHRLQALPAPPAYRPGGLLARWLGIAAITLLAAVGAIVALARAAR
jgi:hypothetical protein